METVITIEATGHPIDDFALTVTRRANRLTKTNTGDFYSMAPGEDRITSVYLLCRSEVCKEKQGR